MEMSVIATGTLSSRLPGTAAQPRDDRDVVPPADEAELVVFNMADAARPGAVVRVASEDGVRAFV